MTNYIQTTANPQFIGQFYEKNIKPLPDLKDSLLVFCEGSGLRIEKKTSYTATKLLRKYWYKVSFDFATNCQRFIEAVKLSKTNCSDPLQASRLCFAIDSLARHVIEVRKNDVEVERMHKELEQLGFHFLRMAASAQSTSRLTLALSQGMLQAALFLVEEANPEDRIVDASRHLHALLALAYNQKKYSLCLKLIEHGADPKKAIAENTAAAATKLLWIAFKERKEVVVKRLVEAGADLKCRENQDGAYPLHVAARLQFHDAICAMLARGADINARDSAGNTALHEACRSLNLPTAKLLTSLGADVSQVNHQGHSAFFIPSTIPNQREEVANFYQSLFKDYSLDRKQLLRFGIGIFLTTETVLRPAVNPFEVALLFQNDSLARKVALALSSEQFFAAIEELKKKYPKSNLDLVSFSHLTISSEHFKAPLANIRLREPKRQVELTALIPLLESCHLSAKLTQDYKDGLLQFIERVSQKKELPHENNSTRLKHLYGLVEICIKNIIIELEDNGARPDVLPSKISFFQEIVKLEAGEICAGGYFNFAQKQFRKICKSQDRELTFEEQIYYLLAEYREQLLESVCDSSSKHSTNEHNKLLLDLGEEFAIPGYEMCTHYVEEMGLIPHYQKARDDFLKLLTPANIYRHCIEPAFQDGRLSMQKYREWWHDHVPAEWGQIEAKKVLAEVEKMQRKKTPTEQITAYLTQKGVNVKSGDRDFTNAIETWRKDAYIMQEVYTPKKELSTLGISRMLATLTYPVFTSMKLKPSTPKKTLGSVINRFLSIS